MATINFRISEICGYSAHINVVEKVINKLVLYKHSIGIGNNLIPLSHAIEMICAIERQYNMKNSMLDELLSNGIITQNLRYNNYEGVYVTFEKLDDYLYAKLLVNELERIGVEQFNLKYNNLILYGDVLEAFAIALSEKNNFELFEALSEKRTDENLISSFCNSLVWRKSDTIKSNTLDYINNVVLKSKTGFETLFNTLVLVSTKIGHFFNAEFTVENILRSSMPDRDAIYIPLFEEFYYEDGSSINRLLDWCLYLKNSENISEETIRLSSIMVATFLLSSNNSLRDKSTKALVKLLSGKVNILISVLDKFKDVDDPYIVERLYAVAFGCIVSEQTNTEIEKLALYVYNRIFNTEYVYPNILLRDYAKNIIDYAKYKVASDRLISLNVLPPYKSEFPKVPTDEDISKYEYDYTASDFKDYYWSQNALLGSMRVEYDRNGSYGGYGDFGRYTFQSYFSNWNGLNYNDLENIAIKKIFDMGYDVERHGRYDQIIGSGRHRDNSRERIGKKYQWIALYELAAQVADKYKMRFHTNCYGEETEIYCLGTFESYLRNIDPTISLLTINNDDKRKAIHTNLYQFPSSTNDDWIGDLNDLPSINDMINIEYNKHKFTLLSGWYTWQEEKGFGNKQYQNPQKDMWVLINSYIVKKEYFEKYIDALSDVDFMGRWAAEPHVNSLFNKEYYWSEGYRFYQNPYYCGEELVEIDKRYDFLEKVLVPSFIYSSEHSGDRIGDNSVSWYKPCSEIFNALELMYENENTVLYDKDKNIICFDSNEVLHEKIGFFININSLEKFLDQKGYAIFWTIIAEKRIIQDSYAIDKRKFDMPHISGLFYYNSDGRLIQSIKEFDN